MGLPRASATHQGPAKANPAKASQRRSSSDLVRLYLQDIGRVDLLSHEQELTLARQVQQRERLLRSVLRQPILLTEPCFLSSIPSREEVRATFPAGNRSGLLMPVPHSLSNVLPVSFSMKFIH